VESNGPGFGELAVLLAGGWILFGRLAGLREDSVLTFATGENGIRMARVLFAISLIPIGLSHLVYSKATADLVPQWLPFRIGWAYLTGVVQMACGIGLLFSIYPRIAAWAETGMLSLFTLLVWSRRFWPRQQHGSVDGVLHFMCDYVGRLAGG
jgi:uncharacterized membrane protein